MESKNKNKTGTDPICLQHIHSAIVDVEFGSPMKNCLHFGICRVTVATLSINENASCCRCRATICFLKENLLQFIFDRNDLPDKAFNKYFNNGFFQVDDEYEMPASILNKIGGHYFTIQQGQYPVLPEKNSLKIIF